MLSRRDIEKELGKGINLYPLKRENIKENSINLTTSDYAWTLGNATVHWLGDNKFTVHNTANPKRTLTIRSGKKCVFFADREKTIKYILLLPHSTTLIETEEVIGVANYIGGALHSKVGLVAKGIGHIGTMLGPGYCGHLMISLHNITDDVIAIKVGSTCVSLAFDYLSTQVVRTSTTVSGHVDKFAELGLNANEEDRSFITADWKANLEEIREKMIASQEYKDYRAHINKNMWQEVKKYINKRNIIAVIAVALIFATLLWLATWADSRLENPVWVERFWNVGLSGFVGSILLGVWGFLKDKK